MEERTGLGIQFQWMLQPANATISLGFYALLNALIQ